MEIDQEIAIASQLNLNDQSNEKCTKMWENSIEVSDDNHSLEKDFEFIRKHAGNIDSDFIHSLLLSAMDKPNRLEAVMCDELSIPNALELIQNFRKRTSGSGEKRGSQEFDNEEAELKRQRTNSSAVNYINQIQDMFPDADRLFLISECQHIKTDEEYVRFLNTVMISGVYVKKGALGFSEQNNSSVGVIDVENDSSKTSVVIDISESNDSTQSYNPPDESNLREIYEEAVKDSLSFNLNDSEPFADEIRFVMNPVRQQHDVSLENDSSINLQQLNNTFDDLDENKPLAEIIEEKREKRESTSPRTRNVASTETSLPSTSSKNNTVEVPEIDPAAWEELDVDVDQGYTDDLSETKWVEEQTADLIRIFPNTDPSFLREEVLKMNKSADAMNVFVITKLERNDMPTRTDYEKKKEMLELQNRYTNNFSIQDFLKAVPDPWKHFSVGNRNCMKYKSHSLCYLRSYFRKHYIRDILNVFNDNKCNLYLSYKALKKAPMRMRSIRRSEFECNVNRPTTIDIQFLQEVAFIENEDKIADYIQNEERLRKNKFEEAKAAGSLLECQCCFDSEVMVEDTVYCPKDHSFCKDCVIKSVEVEMGNGRSQFKCLASCDEKFTLSCLQTVLKPELFSKVIQANQMEEIRAAGIEDLVQCPFCTYATIMPPEQKVMTCLNPECLKESCRLCKELNHIPLKCDEVEKSEEIKMRTYIENKMTEALIRTCYKCGNKFVKEDGCNKMTCTCGAKMCYVCRKPVTDYSHFNGQGGTEYHKCPLYSTNDELHVDLVLKVGEEAKAKILQANPNGKLIHDPTVIMPERTHDRPMPGMNNRAARLRERRAMQEIFGEAGNGDSEDDNNEIVIENENIPNQAEAGNNGNNNRRHRHRRRRRGRQQTENYVYISDDEDDDEDDDELYEYLDDDSVMYDENEEDDSSSSEDDDDESDDSGDNRHRHHHNNRRGHHNHNHHRHRFRHDHHPNHNHNHRHHRIL